MSRRINNGPYFTFLEKLTYGTAFQVFRYRMKFMNRHRVMWQWAVLRYCPCKWLEGLKEVAKLFNNKINWIGHNCLLKHVKVKQSHYGPGVTQRVPGS